MQKLQNVAAEGVMPGDGPSARRVQTVLRFTQRLIKDYERAYGTDDFLDDDFQACDMKCFEFEMVRFSSGILGVDKLNKYLHFSSFIISKTFMGRKKNNHRFVVKL